MRLINPIRTLVLAIFALVTLAVNAIPADPTPFTVVNSDGKELTLVRCGDETFHFLMTVDGVPVRRDSIGDYYEVPELRDSLFATWRERRAERSAERQMRHAQVLDTDGTGFTRSASSSKKYVGSYRGLVILVDFPSEAMLANHTADAFSQLFNEEGYSKNDNTGSVHDYFYDMSYGQFDITFDVVGPVTVSNPKSYYGQNRVDRRGNEEAGSDMYAGRLVMEACRLANRQNNLDWTDYDWDSDGYVDMVYIVCAGHDEAAGGESDDIWSHEFSLSGWNASRDRQVNPISFNGTYVNTYAMSSELRGKTVVMNAIGTACHEFAHCLGLADTYDTSYSGGFGMDYWSLMAAGNYGGVSSSAYGTAPSPLTAWERAQVGWMELTPLTATTTITGMPALIDEPVAYCWTNPSNADEMFVVENRQSNKWDRYVKCYTDVTGLLMTHIDYSSTIWYNNTINSDADHQRFTIVPASGNFGTYNKESSAYSVSTTQYRGHLFPGNYQVTELTATSHASVGGKWFTETDGSDALNGALVDITERDGLIDFRFLAGNDAVSIDRPNSADDSSVAYFTLSGIAIERPTAPGIYIVRKGGETKKVVVK